MSEIFKAKNLNEISPFLIEAWENKRKEEASVSFNRQLGTLKTRFNWCIDNGRFDGINPTRKVKRLPESHGRQRALEPEEEPGRQNAPNLLGLSCFVVSTRGCGFLPRHYGSRKPMLTYRTTWSLLWLHAPKTARLHAAMQRIMQSNPESEYLFTRANGKPFKSIQNIFRAAAKGPGYPIFHPM